METNLTTPKPKTPAQQFGHTVNALAAVGLAEMFGSANGKAAAARVGTAFRAAASAAKDPNDLYRCTPESVATCMAISAMTQIMPGGPNPGCYLIPKGGALGWWISARGIKTLARRAGQIVATFPYFTFDTVAIDEFEQTMALTKGDGHRDDYSQLVGIVVLVRDIATGTKLAMRNVSRAQIEKRRMKSLQPNGGPWKEWPMEMAEKTAVKFAAARGEIVFDDVGNTTMTHDAETIDAGRMDRAAEARPQIAQSARLDEALGLEPDEAEKARILDAENREAGGK